MKSTVKILVFLFFLSSLLSAQCLLKGKITERRSKKQLVNAKVILSDSIKVLAEVTTDDKGFYKFENMPIGNYSITIKAKNFRDTIFKRTVVKGENIFDFVLSQYRRAQPPRGR